VWQRFNNEILPATAVELSAEVAMGREGGRASCYNQWHLEERMICVCHRMRI
jgi:hypothetical protein